ncbi:MAG: alpha/beta hydrolase [Oceanospirillales bacterium LUC14_002_19_P2]|nr:MAG: alpha/beta hydrolase [Oceanospirillales bacterium LUC14_002_19_P2]
MKKTDWIWNGEADAQAPILILAHGAGAAMDSDFMDTMAERLAAQGIRVVRFEFPYMQERRHTGKERPPDRQPILLQAWRDVIAQVRETTGVETVFIGGKSMGGRMATLLAAEAPETGLVGVVCLGYPFHAPGKTDKPRIDHLMEFPVPIRIIQGDRDAMGNRETVEGYGLSSRLDIQWLPDGNHDLKPRKASGHTHDEHLTIAAEKVAEFIRSQ